MNAHRNSRLVALAVAAAACLALAAGCSDDSGSGTDSGGAQDGGAPDTRGPDLQPADQMRPDAPRPVTCAAGSKTGKTGSTNGLKTPVGVKYNVRVPSSYSPTVGSPLLMVYAAAGGTADNMEPYTRLTAPANAQGYIVVYVDHVSPRSTGGVDDIARIPSLVADSWCVDTHRVYFTGHSDGGSVIYIMLARDSVSYHPAAIAPSAAGLSKQSFSAIPCLKYVLPVMVLHSKNDQLFPGFGRDARDWWVNCYGCTSTGVTQADGCVAYPGCKGWSEVQYCEGSLGHSSWLGMNTSMLAFFKRFSR
jgi:polyhydroxybutyrate depolymerase